MLSLQSMAQPLREPRPSWRATVLGEDLFAAALDREFRRADRFDEAFALAVVSMDERDETEWRDAIAAATAVARPTDVFGWLSYQRSLAIVRPLAPIGPASVSAAPDAALREELAQALRRAAVSACAVRVEVFASGSDERPPAPRSRARRETVTDALSVVSKRTFDVAGSMALLALLAPVFLVIAGLVRWSSRGPILFRQTRVGRHGQPFTMLKFRTMHANSDETVHEQYVTQFIQGGSAVASQAGVFKIVNDRRVTPVGHFLRRSSLDELPQFWNVFRGEMSLVGPRPSLPYEVARYKRWHRRRLSAAKPGITGLWQVTARSRATFDEMVRLDLQYARNPSLWTDIRILLATPRAVFSGRGAH